MPLGRDFNTTPVQAFYIGPTLDLDVTNTSNQSAVIEGRFIRVCSSVDCRIRVGDSPVAVATDVRLPANVVEYFAFTPVSGLLSFGLLRPRLMASFPSWSPTNEGRPRQTPLNPRGWRSSLPRHQRDDDWRVIHPISDLWRRGYR